MPGWLSEKDDHKFRQKQFSKIIIHRSINDRVSNSLGMKKKIESKVVEHVKRKWFEGLSLKKNNIKK